MAIADMDAWLGKTLFVPPIITLCQFTRQTQFAVSRLFWFVVALDQLRVAQTLAQQVIAGLFAVAMMLTASFRADLPSMSMLWFRMLALAFLVLDVLHGVLRHDWIGVEIWLLVLFAEYAATIRTIPPGKTGKREHLPREQRANSRLRRERAVEIPWLSAMLWAGRGARRRRQARLERKSLLRPAIGAAAHPRPL